MECPSRKCFFIGSKVWNTHQKILISVHQSDGCCFFSSSKIKLFLYMYALYTLSERYREKIHSMKLNKYNRIKLVNGLVRDETSGLNLAPSYLKNNNYGLGVLFSNIRRRSISWLATYSTVSLRQSQPFHFIRVIKRIEK